MCNRSRRLCGSAFAFVMELLGMLWNLISSTICYGKASPFPAHSHEKTIQILNWDMAVIRMLKRKDILLTMAVAMVKEMGTCQVGDVDLSPSYGGEKVGLITPSPSTDVKQRCISYYHGLDHVEISYGLNSGSYAIPNQRVNTSDIISQKGKVQRNEKATHLKKRKMKTMNLFKLIQIKQRDKLMNDMKKSTPRLRSS
nr:hypothetical protein [Tanacetum cinerariifolium]